MKRSKYVTAYSLIGLCVLLQISIGVYVGLTSTYSVANCIAFTLFVCNICTFGYLPMVVVYGSFSFGSWIWAYQHDLTCCVHVKEPRDVSLFFPISVYKISVADITDRLTEYGRRTFGKSAEHIRGYCLNMVGSEIYGMAMKTRSYSIGDYYKNYSGDDFGCSKKTWGAVKDMSGRTICYWGSSCSYMLVATGTNVDDILMEMDIALGKWQEVILT